MATLFPQMQFFTDTGEVLAGGSLTFYAAGTDDLKDVFDGEDGIISLDNPIELSSEGRVPEAGVWCLGDYKVILRDADDVPIWTVDHANFQDLVDWSTLTATVSQLNAAAGATGTPGVVVANKAVVVDGSKDIATFGILTGATLRATSAVRTPQINDTNNVAAVTIPAVTSQVNSITVTPAITTASPSIAASGADTNISLSLAGKGTGAVKLSGLSYPVADGAANTVMTSNGAGVLSLAVLPTTSQVVKQVVVASYSTYTTITSVIPYDDTIPQITEGTQIISQSITPTSASSTLYITVSGGTLGASTGNPQISVAVFRDATANAIGATSNVVSAGFSYGGTLLNASVPSTSTSSTTFTVRVGTNTGTIYTNGISSGRKLGGVSAITMTIMEV